MAKYCGKCEKIVYPAEELKCLDKTWHKGCFKCWHCGMQLNLKNYRGFNKLPYCNAHSPQIKATSVAETPEQRRLKDISKLNSQVLYQKEYRENMGNVISVADDPETRRIKGLGALSSTRYADTPSQGSYTQPMRSSEADAEQGYGQQEEEEEEEAQAGGGGGDDEGLIFTAMYNYDANDTDEASIVENDRIVNCEVVDEGWIMGTVERTGQKGLIPKNYVEAA